MEERFFNDIPYVIGEIIREFSGAPEKTPQELYDLQEKTPQELLKEKAALKVSLEGDGPKISVSSEVPSVEALLELSEDTPEVVILEYSKGEELKNPVDPESPMVKFVAKESLIVE